MFFILNVLFIRSLNNNTLNQKIMVSLVCISYGGILEILQSVLFEERSGDVFDFIANAFGVILAFFLFKKLKNRYSFLF